MNDLAWDPLRQMYAELYIASFPSTTPVRDTLSVDIFTPNTRPLSLRRFPNVAVDYLPRLAEVTYDDGRLSSSYTCSLRADQCHDPCQTRVLRVLVFSDAASRF